MSAVDRSVRLRCVNFGVIEDMHFQLALIGSLYIMV